MLTGNRSTKYKYDIRKTIAKLSFDIDGCLSG